MSFDSGLYTIKQLSTSRYLDAQAIAPFAASTNNVSASTWYVSLYPLGGVYTIQQKSNGRYLDAQERLISDFSAVTKEEEGNSSQKWVLMGLGSNTYTIQQLNTGRFLDAYQATDLGKDFAAVTREKQNNDTQQWVLKSVGTNTYRIRQKSNDRYLDAYQETDAGKGCAVVTREAGLVLSGQPDQDDTQKWILKPVGYVCAIIKSDPNDPYHQRYLDAYQEADAGQDCAAVTRENQNNDTQRWVLLPLDVAPESNQRFRIQQVSNCRYLDAYESSANGYAVVTRELQDNDSQMWVLEPFTPVVVD